MFIETCGDGDPLILTEPEKVLTENVNCILLLELVMK